MRKPIKLTSPADKALSSIPQSLLNLYFLQESDCFHELKYSDHAVVIGCGEKVHFFNLENQRLKSYTLDSYFGHLYPLHDLDSTYIESDILVASAAKLYLFSSGGGLKWESPLLGIDGVIVYAIDGHRIQGAGDFDPPGGWRDFTIEIEVRT